MSSELLMRDACPGRVPAMTRCECVRVSFERVAHAMREQGLSREAAIRGSGCGALCSACLPDLEHFLRGR